ncbi:MAG: hypothetical protein K2K91_01470 [Ruminococcus sp.]|nr:hypothetical protein [Ruminococcus sp.]
MNKIIVQVYLPADGRTYDIRVPENMYIYDAVNVMAELFAEISKGFYCKGDVNILCMRDKGESLPQNKTFRELKIANRTELMFV